MTIADNLNRIIQAKNDIKDAIESKGVYVSEYDTLDTYGAAIRQIEQGSGGGGSNLVVLPNGISFANSTMSEFDGYGYDWSLVYDGYEMFCDCSELTNIYNFPVKMLFCARMFYNCTNLVEVPKIDTTECVSMKEMFYGCGNITSLPEIDTSHSYDMRSFCNTCINLVTVPPLYTPNVTDMFGIFQYCSRLESVELTDISSVETMQYAFCLCSRLTLVKFGGNPVNLTNVDGMFMGVSTNGTMYYPAQYESSYQPIINVLPSNWTAVPY